MARKCEHGLSTRECFVCVSPKYGATSALATSASLALPFPMREGYTAQIVVPRDMTHAEAQRLCEFVKSLAAP